MHFYNMTNIATSWHKNAYPRGHDIVCHSVYIPIKISACSDAVGADSWLNLENGDIPVWAKYSWTRRKYDSIIESLKQYQISFTLGYEMSSIFEIWLVFREK